MATTDDLQKAHEKLTMTDMVHGWDGIVREHADLTSELANSHASNRRYRKQLAETVDMLTALYDETGFERLLDAANDLRRLIQWADTGSMPIQLDLFEMPSDEEAS